MKCPECVKEGKRSIVTARGGVSAAMYCAPYYDEDGAYHYHDWNSYMSFYGCSNGHSFSELSDNKCPNNKCDWTNKRAED